MGLEKLNALASEVRVKMAAMQMTIDSLVTTDEVGELMSNETGEIIAYVDDESGILSSAITGSGKWLTEEADFWSRLYREEKHFEWNDNIVPLIEDYM